MNNIRKLYFMFISTVFTISLLLCSFYVPKLTAFQAAAKEREMISQSLNYEYLSERGFTKTTINGSDSAYIWRADDMVYSYYIVDSQIFGSYQKNIGAYTLTTTKSYDNCRYTISLNDCETNLHCTAELDINLHPVSDSSFADNCVPVEIANNEDSYRYMLQYICTDDIKNAADEYSQFTKHVFADKEALQ